MNEEKKTILPESDEAASIQTVTGWVSRTGRFFGPANSADAEHMARYDGSTHRSCDKCGKVIEKNSYCRPCSGAREIEKYNNMERKEWNGKDGLYSQTFNGFLWDQDDIDYLCEENDCTPADLRLIICDPSYAHPIDPAEIYENLLFEDGEVPTEVQKAFDELNERLKDDNAILAWFPGEYAMQVTP